ncbi:MAG: ABC transporter substrate-binding protein [Chloroherpetonaceae bacterium]|nr:ABC transporter substrate-binding protein [Chloroherpetonaceae bacterium]
MNPILITDSNSRDMNFLVFPHLFEETFDTTVGITIYKPFVAQQWAFSDSNRVMTVQLRGDLKWTDGAPVTSSDWKFSYELYGDPIIGTTRQNFCDDFLRKPDGSIDFEKSIETPDNQTLVIRFSKSMPAHVAYKYTNLAFIPYHIWKNVNRKDIRTDERNFKNEKIVSCGPYRVSKWVKNQELTLIADDNFPITGKPKIEKFLMRVIPEYTTRITLLKTGGADMVQSLTPEDAIRIKNDSLTHVYERGYVFYDIVNWMNIDIEDYHRNKEIALKSSEKKPLKINPHPLFGSKNVRKALTYAIDRQSIVDGHLQGYGKLAVSDVVLECKWAQNPSLSPYPYDPEQAKKLLAADGWKPGSDGILTKNGRPFSFTLFINNGNQRRNYAATVIQQNLRSIGIECNVQSVESNILQEQIRNRKLDAFVFGFAVVPPDIDPAETRKSDFENTPYNQNCFQNSRVDELIELGRRELNVLNTAKYWKEYAKIIYDEQPETILYWWTNLTGISKRVKNASPSSVSSLDRFYEWEIE